MGDGEALTAEWKSRICHGEEGAVDGHEESRDVLRHRLEDYIYASLGLQKLGKVRDRSVGQTQETAKLPSELLPLGGGRPLAGD
jgi:hypothetical protein